MIRLAPGALWKEFAKTPKLIEARSRDHPQPIRKEYTVNQKRAHREKEAHKAPKEEAKRTTKVRFAPGQNYPRTGKSPFVRGSHKAPSESLQNASAPKPASPAPKNIPIGSSITAKAARGPSHLLPLPPVSPSRGSQSPLTVS